MEQTKTILVVDDEEMIEEMIQAVLESRGCRTTSFTDPREALRFLVGNPDRVVLLITDFRMPALSGPDLIRRALQVTPGLPVIAVSGRQEEYRLDGIRDSILRILPKPFVKSEMINAVDTALARANQHCPLT